MTRRSRDVDSHLASGRWLFCFLQKGSGLPWASQLFMDFLKVKIKERIDVLLENLRFGLSSVGCSAAI